MECNNCGTVHYDTHCLFCEYRREELLERLQADRKAAGLAEVASWAMFEIAETPERCWRVG